MPSDEPESVYLTSARMRSPQLKITGLATLVTGSFSTNHRLWKSHNLRDKISSCFHPQARSAWKIVRVKRIELHKLALADKIYAHDLATVLPSQVDLAMLRVLDL